MSEQPIQEILKQRTGNKWRVPVSADGVTRIPRVFASLRSAHLEGAPDNRVSVHPGIEFWELKFDGDPSTQHIILEFDSPAIVEGETQPIPQAGDGTLTLPCSMGITHGDKLRFEPQPHKNTIGYWVNPKDSVSWPIKITKPGSFNVGVLQGAGNNGGGIARVSLWNNESEVDSFEFPVEVTEHFQNFRWLHAGALNANEPGDYSLKVEAVKITKTALMDIRQIHLSPKR